MKNKGFTLIELLVVIAIVGLLASIVLGSLSQSRNKALDAKRIQNLKEVQKAMELYAANNGGKYKSTDGNWYCFEGSSMGSNWMPVVYAGGDGSSPCSSFSGSGESDDFLAPYIQSMSQMVQERSRQYTLITAAYAAGGETTTLAHLLIMSSEEDYKIVFGGFSDPENIPPSLRDPVNNSYAAVASSQNVLETW